MFTSGPRVATFGGPGRGRAWPSADPCISASRSCCCRSFVSRARPCAGGDRGIQLLGQRRFAGGPPSRRLRVCGILRADGLARFPLLPSSVLLKCMSPRRRMKEPRRSLPSWHNPTPPASMTPPGFRLMLLGLALACAMWPLRSDPGRADRLLRRYSCASDGAHLAFEVSMAGSIDMKPTSWRSRCWPCLYAVAHAR